MKKRNFITGFSAAFVATLALISCGGIRAKDGIVLSINGHEYSALDLFGDQKSAASAEAKFNAVYKVTIRRYFESGQPGSGMMGEVTRETKLKIEGAKEEARNNASKNGTKYDVEWKKILSSNGVDSESGLYDKFEYDVMKTKFEDKFYENNYDTLRMGGWLHEEGGDREKEVEGVKKLNGYINEKQPYHMKHILVNITAKDKDNTSGEITEGEANNIYTVVKQLAEGVPFEQVSQNHNDDAEAKKHNGSLGIMSRDTNFVNDFKLGTYMYEAFYGSSTPKAKENLSLVKQTPDEKNTAAYYAEKISKLDDPTTTGDGDTKGIGQIPYGEILKFAPKNEITRQYYEEGETKLSEVKDGIAHIEFKDEYKTNFENAGLTSSDIKAKYYPRNVIFNKYFNKHNIMVITTQDAPTINDDTSITDYLQKPKNRVIRSDKKDNVLNNETDPRFEKLPGFKVKGKNDDELNCKLPSTNNKVLRDNNGRVIFVFRSGTSSSSSSNATNYQGIHFVVIERSPFIKSENDIEGDEKTATTLDEYYTQYYPMETGVNKHPKYKEGQLKDQDKYTYTNWIRNETKAINQKNRADTVKTELKKADDNLNTYIYEYLLSTGKISFTSTANAQLIKQTIENWITYTKRDNTDFNKETKWNDTWRTYYNSLTAQFEQRKEVSTTVEEKPSIVSRLVPEVCVAAFQNKCTTYDLKALFGPGGVFHD